MADLSVGNIVASLRIDTSQLAQGMQQAQQALGQLQRTVQGQVSAAQQLSPAMRQAMQETAIAARQAAQESSQAFRREAQERTLAAQQAAQAARAQFQQIAIEARTAAQQSSQAFAREMAQIRQSQAQSRDFLGGVLQIAGGVGIATSLGALTSGMVAFSKSVVETGVNLQNLRASLAAIGGGVAQGAQQFNFLLQTANQLGVAFTPIVGGWRQLTAAATQANFPIAEQQRLFTALLTEGRRVGANSQEIGRAIQALAQVAGKSVLSMEELRQQLGEAIPTALGAAARGMGRTTEELIKLVETGSVRAIPFFQALTRGFEQMNQGANAFREGAAQAFARLGNALTSFKDAIAQNVLPELERLAKIATGILTTATNLLNITGGRGAGAAGPSREELGFTQAETGQVERLQRIRDQLRGQLATATQPVMQETYATRLRETEALIEQIHEGVRARNAETQATEKATAASNQAQNAREREVADLKNLHELLERFTKTQREFQQRAGLAPELTGRLGGTADEAEQYRRGMEGELRKPFEAIIEAQRQFQGVIPPEVLQRIQAARAAFGQLTTDERRADEAARQRREAEREALAGDRERRRQAMATGQEYLRGVEQENQAIEANMDALERLANAYGLSKQTRDADTASALEAALANTRYAEEAQRLAQSIQDVARIEAQLPDLRRQADLSAPAGERALQAARDAEAFAQRVQGQIDQQMADRLQRPEARLRAEAMRGGVEITPDLEAQLKRLTALREEQERLNQVVELWSDLASGVGSAWSSAMQGIASHTKTVAEAFREMGRSILQTMGQIASQEAFKALFRLGASVLTGALTGGGQAGFGAGSGFDVGLRNMQPLPAVALAGGGVVRRPTIALMGERGSEYVVPEQQMRAMQGTLRAGGEGGGRPIVNIHEHPDRASAEQAAAQDRARGEEAIVRAVLSDMQQGSGSRINQLARRMQQ